MSTCYANPNPIFQPAMRLIAAISKSTQAQVTTTFAHQYVSGTIVRLDVPSACGMPQINGTTTQIFVTGATTFLTDIDSSLFDTFAIPMAPNPHDNTCAMVVPIGEINEILDAAVRNVLPFN